MGYVCQSFGLEKGATSQTTGTAVMEVNLQFGFKRFETGFFFRKIQNLPSYQVSVKNLLDHYPQFVKISEVGKENIWTIVQSAGEHESKSDTAHTNHCVGSTPYHSHRPRSRKGLLEYTWLVLVDRELGGSGRRGYHCIMYRESRAAAEAAINLCQQSAYYSLPCNKCNT